MMWQRALLLVSQILINLMQKPLPVLSFNVKPIVWRYQHIERLDFAFFIDIELFIVDEIDYKGTFVNWHCLLEVELLKVGIANVRKVIVND